MKNYVQVLLLMFGFSFMTLSALKCSDGVDPFVPAEKSTLIIDWVAIPEGMDSIQFEISSTSLTSNIVKKFAFSDDTGSIPDFLENITLDIQITGYNSAQSVVCHGKIDSIKTTTPTTIVALNAYNVTPYKPDSLVTTPISNDKISIQWKYNAANADYFTLYRMTGNIVSDSISPITTTSFIDSGLTPNQWYAYYVKGYNASGYSLPSDIDSAIINMTDNQGPTITITSHTNPDTVQTQEITLAGTVTDTSGIYQFFVNDSLQNVINNTWQVDNLLLTSSVNIINIKAYDNSPAQNLTDTSIMIIYKDSLANNPPVFTTTTNDMTDSITLGEVYKDTVTATDPDTGDNLTYSVVNGPVSIGASTGIVTWTPATAEQVSVTARVTDDSSAYDDLTWSITVIDTVTIKPNITGDPQPVTVNAGQTATFGVIATGTKPFIYKWQKNGADISGGTDSSYTTPPTVIGDSGSTFRCIVSNSVGSDTSAAALLKVTSNTVVTDIDGNVYQTVVIGSQVWTAENLRTTRYNDGTAVPKVTDSSAWANLTTPGYCYYDNDSAANAVKYGALYNWYTVNTGKLAPQGWHVPDTSDWNILQNYLIANGYNWDGTTTGNKIAKSMATKTDWNSSSTGGSIGNDMSSNNSSGFSALPGAYRHPTDNFNDIGNFGHWWCATDTSSTNAYRRRLAHDSDDLHRNNLSKKFGYSVRLMRD